MDANLKRKIEFLGTNNQQLANAAVAATDHYNWIIKNYFDSTFWQAAGVRGGASSLVVSAVVPSCAAAGVSIYNQVSAITTDVIIDGVTYSGTVEGVTTAATAGGGIAGGAIATACTYVAIGIAVYFSAKYITKAVLSKKWVKQGERKLKSLSPAVIQMRVYCNSMSSNIESALNHLKIASEKIAIAEKKIANQQYATQKSNLTAIRERQAEIVGLYGNLANTNELVKIVKSNLDKLV